MVFKQCIGVELCGMQQQMPATPFAASYWSETRVTYPYVVVTYKVPHQWRGYLQLCLMENM